MLEHMHQKFQNGREETLLEADVHAHMQPRKKILDLSTLA
jgi:hypothetical protein